MEETDYASLIEQLQRALAETQGIDLEMAPAEADDTFLLGFGDIELELYPHPDKTRVVIEATVGELDDPGSAELAERLLLLMKLNTLARFSSGVQLGVEEDNTVIAYVMADLCGLDLDRLAAELLHMVDRVTSLRSAWDRLDEFLAQSSSESPSLRPKVEDFADLDQISALRV